MSVSMNGYGGAEGLYYHRYYPSPAPGCGVGGAGADLFGAAWAGEGSPGGSSGRSMSPPPSDEYQPPPTAADFLAPMPTLSSMSAPQLGQTSPGGRPTVKRRCTANKKERRRTQSINAAFSLLRDHIPGIPGDTKLSKIKTLKHAIAYINHLMQMLGAADRVVSVDTARSAFRVDLQVGNGAGRARAARQLSAPAGSAHLTDLDGLDHAAEHHHYARRCSELENMEVQVEGRKNKGRTGWPQHVWVHNELKH